MKTYPNDDPDEAARKSHEEWKEDGWHSVSDKDKDNDNSNNRNKDKKKDKDNDKDNKKHPHYIQKYTEPGLLAAEAVLVRGIPSFAVSRAASKDITLEESIPIDDKNEYSPFGPSAYLSEPYRFKSKQHFEASVEAARGEKYDSLYRKVKAIWSKYVDADDFHISMCAADTFFTYYQDKIGLTHYPFFVGSPGSGKSNNLSVLKYLAYRTFVSTDMTAANIYQFLGSGEEGQGTLCEDEADRIDEDRQKMAIYKNGYIKGFPVARTDTSFGRKQQKYNTFCFKAFAAERFPDPVKAKGFNQRIIELRCAPGNPQYDIAEVTDETGAEEFQQLRDELNEMHNILLLSRLLHFHQVIPDIKLNIKGREKQLFKPVIRLFQKTETQVELLPVISNYVMQKREANISSLHAFLYRTITYLIADRQTTKLQSSFIWDFIKANLHGSEIHSKPLSYASSEFGELSQKEITQTLEHIFEARPKKSHGVTALLFDTAKLKRLGNVYNLSPEVKVKEKEKETEGEETGEDGEDGEDVGLDRHLIGHGSSEEITKSYCEDSINHIDYKKNYEEFKSVRANEGHSDPVHLPNVPHLPPIEIKQEIKQHEQLVYRLGNSDLFACQKCKQRGDRWFMQQHLCGGK